MLDLKFIREHRDAVEEGCRKKRITVDLDKLLRADEALRTLQTDVEAKLAERNRLSKTIGAMKPEEREEAKKSVHALKAEIDLLEEKVKPLKEEVDALLLLVPQPPRDDVPVGKDDSENVELRRVGKVPEFSFKPKSHEELGKLHRMIDTERGVKLAGSRSYILQGWGARLEQAVLRLTYDLLVQRGYTPVTVPVLVKEEAMVGTGYFPVGREQAYIVEKDELVLVGTAEVSLTSLYSGEILNGADLPVKMMSWSSCFRREAGTYGKDTAGLYRVHQFQKIEQVIIGPNDVNFSEKMHTELLTNAEDVLQALEIPYRVVYVCTGDLGQGQVRKHDIESWMPSRNNYGETHSCSTFHEFQARRLKLRYRDKEGKVHVCHTLNNTAIASPRVLISLTEVHQQADGSIAIPKALQPYLGGVENISPT